MSRSSLFSAFRNHPELMYRDTMDKIKIANGLSSWEEAHSKLISLDEEQRRSIDNLEGEQLEEIIAATPLDLSVFHNVPIKTSRNSESPLDLSLKTRKRIADSTEEEDGQYWFANALKRVCPGVSTISSGVYVSDRHINAAMTGKNSSPVISNSSRENIQSHHAVKGDIKSGCDVNSSSVIKHGFRPTTNQGLQHGIPHLCEKLNNTNMSVHTGYIQNERKPIFGQNCGNFEPVKGGLSRNNDRKYYNSKLSVPAQHHQPQALSSAQDQSADIQRQRFYKHAMSQQGSGQISGHSFQAPKRRNPSIVVGTVCSSPSTILQYHPVHMGSPISPSLNRHSPFVETVQRCSPDSTIPVNSPQRMSPNEIECYEEKMRQISKSENLRTHQNKQISPQVFHPHSQSQKYGYMHYNEPMSPCNPGSSSSSSSTSPCIMSSSGEKSPMMMSHGSPQSFLAISPSPLSSRSQMYASHSQTRSRENSPLGVRNFPHSLSPLVHSAYSTSHSFSPQTIPIGKGRERSPTIRPCKAQERSISKGTSGMFRGGPNSQLSLNDSQTIPNVCDKKRVISENPPQHYIQQTKQSTAGHIPSTETDLLTQPKQQCIGDKMLIPMSTSTTRVKVEASDQLERNLHRSSEKRYMLQNNSATQSSGLDKPHLMKVEKVELSSCQQNDCSTTLLSKQCQIHADNRITDRNNSKNEDSELDRYSYPLTIAIPTSVGTNSRQQPVLKSPEPPATSVRAPRPFSKKQIIMNAVNNDECLKKIVNSPITPRPSKQEMSSISGDFSNTNRLQNHSPSFPESPKMPTLSPQQKLSPAMVTPMTVEPPTLAPAATLSAQRLRQESNVKMSMLRKLSSYCATDVKSDRPIESECKQNEDASLKEDGRLYRYDHAILGGNAFGKRQGLKNIPIANVSPMVHGHSAKSVSSSNVNTNSVIVKTTFHRKDQNVVSRLQSHEQQKESLQITKCLNNRQDVEQQSNSSHEKLVEYIDDSVIANSRNLNCVFLQDDSSRESGLIKDQEINPTKRVHDFETMKSMECIDDESHKGELFKDQHNADDDDDEDRKQLKLRSRQKSLLQEIANSDGYVAESKATTKSEDLLVDPALLGREERALRRAIMQFNDMEEKVERPSSPKSPTKVSNTILKADEIRRKARRNRQSRNDRLIGRQKWIGRRKRKKKMKQKGFIDFQPEVIASRTRTQAAGQKPLIRYDRNAAYERELSRDENRKAQKRRERLRQTARRICRRMSRRHDEQHRSQTDGEPEVDQVESAPEKGTDCDDFDCDGMWEVGRTSNALKQTLRSGKSKGGLMLKLLFKPQKTKYRFGRRHSPRHSAYQLRTSPLKDSKKLSGSSVKNDNLDIGSKLKNMRRRQQIARQRLTDRRKQKITSNEADFPTFQEQDIPEVETTEITQDDAAQSAFPFPVEVKKLAVCRDTGETILHRAARMGYKDTALQCLQSGRVDVNVRDNAGYTPLHESCVSGNLDIANMLLGYGANVNCSSQDGIRPIHDAVENDNVALVRMLLTFGADPTLSTYSGKTPLKIARSEKLQKLLEGHLGDLNGFSEDQQQTVWEFPVLPNGDEAAYMGIFSDIPSDPEEQEIEAHFHQTSDPTFTDFRLTKTDGKETTGRYILLNDVTDFHQVDLKDITNDLKLKSMFTNIPKAKLAATSYGKSHSGRLAAIEDSRCKVISVKELPQLIAICKHQYSRANTAIDESKTIHKFKHYKCMKNVQNKSVKNDQNLSKPEESRIQSDTSDVKGTDGNIRSQNLSSNLNTLQQHYSYFGHSRKIKLLPSTSKQQSPRAEPTRNVNESWNRMNYGGNVTLDDSDRGHRYNSGPNSREYHSKYLDFLKERKCDYDDSSKSKFRQECQTVDNKKGSCVNNNYVQIAESTSGVHG